MMGKKMQSTPPDEEDKKLDTAVKRFYSVGALDVKTMNYIACMVWCDYAIWDSISDVIMDLLEDKRLKVQTNSEFSEECL